MNTKTIVLLIVNIFILAFMMHLLFRIAANKMNNWKMYNRKPRPKKTIATCLETKRILMDFEAMQGRCVSCLSRHTAVSKSGVKSFDDNAIGKCEKHVKQCLR